MSIDVALLAGSPSDLDKVAKATAIFDEFEVAYERRVLSAHRTPVETLAFIKQAEENGAKVFIGCAGMAAHLSGVIAGHTLKPVIGVPLSGGLMAGLDALLATVQMPRGVPVATVAVDGTANAAYLAMQILAIHDDGLKTRLAKQRDDNKSQYDLDGLA